MLIKVMPLFRCNVSFTAKGPVRSHFGSWNLRHQLFCLSSVQYLQVIAENKSSKRREQQSGNLNSVTKDLLPVKGNQQTLSQFLLPRVHYQKLVNKYSITDNQLKEGHFCLVRRNHQLTSLGRCLISGNLHGITINLLKIKESLHCPLKVQYSTTPSQFFAAGNQPTINKNQNNMANSERPTTGFHHVKCPSAVHRGPAVSDDDVQQMADARKIFDQAVDSVLPHHLVRNVSSFLLYKPFRYIIAYK